MTLRINRFRQCLNLSLSGVVFADLDQGQTIERIAIFGILQAFRSFIRLRRKIKAPASGLEFRVSEGDARAGWSCCVVGQASGEGVSSGALWLGHKGFL